MLVGPGVGAGVGVSVVGADVGGGVVGAGVGGSVVGGGDGSIEILGAPLMVGLPLGEVEGTSWGQLAASGYHNSQQSLASSKGKR